jgi:SPFH domain / Band 7 family
MFRFKCPECAISIKASAEKAGKAAICPACKRPIIVPAIRTGDHGDPPPEHRLHAADAEHDVFAEMVGDVLPPNAHAEAARSIEVGCLCGHRFHVRQDHAANEVACPDCQLPVHVPGRTPSAHQAATHTPLGQNLGTPRRREPAASPHQRRKDSGSNTSASAGIGQLFLFLLIAWAFLLLFSLLLAAVVPQLRIATLVVFCIGSVFLLSIAVQLLLAKQRVLTEYEVPLLFGLVKLVAWEPTEGVVVLKDKNVSFVDDTGGGIRLIYPIFGEQLVFRAPLGIQPLDFRDEDVQTREYLPLTIRGMIEWKIVNLRDFYLYVAKEMDHADNRGHHSIDVRTEPERDMLPTWERNPHGPDPRFPSMKSASQKLEVAKQLLRVMAEEQTRTIVSRVNTGLLVAEQVAADLPAEMKEKMEGNVLAPGPIVPSSPTAYRSATDGLAAAIQHAVGEKMAHYGIEIHNVSLQEVRLPEAIHRQCVEACQAAYVPLIAQKKAISRKMELQAEADVLGADNLAAREIVDHAPAYALSDFLTRLIVQNPAMQQIASRPRAKRINEK